MLICRIVIPATASARKRAKLKMTELMATAVEDGCAALSFEMRASRTGLIKSSYKLLDKTINKKAFQWSENLNMQIQPRVSLEPRHTNCFIRIRRIRLSRSAAAPPKNPKITEGKRSQNAKVRSSCQIPSSAAASQPTPMRCIQGSD